MTLEAACREMQAAGEYLLARGLTWGTSGNASVRLDHEAFLVTASGTDLGNLGPEDFVICSLAGDGDVAAAGQDVGRTAGRVGYL